MTSMQAKHFQTAVNICKEQRPYTTISEMRIASLAAEEQTRMIREIHHHCVGNPNTIYIIETISIYVNGMPPKPPIMVNGVLTQVAVVGVCVISGNSFSWIGNNGTHDAIARVLEGFFTDLIKKQCPLCMETGKTLLSACCFCGQAACDPCMVKWKKQAHKCPFCRR